MYAYYIQYLFIYQMKRFENVLKIDKQLTGMYIHTGFLYGTQSLKYKLKFSIRFMFTLLFTMRI